MQGNDLLEGVEIAALGQGQQSGFGAGFFRLFVHPRGCDCHASVCHYPYTPIGAETLRMAACFYAPLRLLSSRKMRAVAAKAGERWLHNAHVVPSSGGLKA